MAKRNPVLILGLIILVIILAGCSGKDAGKQGTQPARNKQAAADDYFPTNVGLYKRFDDGQGGWEETVEAPETYNGKQVVPVHVKMLNEKNEEVEYGGEITLNEFTNLYMVGEEVLLVGTRAKIDDTQIADEPIPVPSVIFKKGVQKGTTWFYDLYNPPGKVKATVVNIETLKTKAGVFERTAKLRLDYVYMDEAGSEVKATAYEWYAPGYGKVRSQGDGEMGTAEVVEVKKV